MPSRTLRDPIPRAALILGLAGALPFLAGALQVATGWPMGPRSTGPALYLLTIYGAIILSFMGGAQWGLAVAISVRRDNDGDNGWHGAASWRRYGLSVVPALIAWAGLWFAARTGLMVLVAGFVTLLVYDLWSVAQGEAPAWYGRLRFGLTSAVVVCLLAAAIFGPF
jgi:Protein of unknown function (DUF3429)